MIINRSGKEVEEMSGWKFWLIWIAGTTFGFALGAFAVGMLDETIGEFIKGAIFGVSIGMVQWLILRNHISFSGLWILLVAVLTIIGFVNGKGFNSSLGSLVATYVATINELITSDSTTILSISMKLIAGLVVGSLFLSLITGYALSALVKRRILKPI